MTKSKLALFIDSLFISFLISSIIYLWTRRILKNANLVNFFCILIFILSFGLIFNLFLRSNKKSIFKINNNKFINSCLNYLITCSLQDYSKYLCTLLGCELIENFYYKKANKIFYINIKTSLTDKDFIEIQEFICNKFVGTTCIILYRKKEKSFDDIFELSSSKFILLDYETLKTVIIQKGIYPIENNQNIKVSFKDKLKTTLKTKTAGISRKHFKELFFSGISLLFLSLIVPFSNYYLIVGTILVTISIITLFKKNYIPTNIDNIKILTE